MIDIKELKESDIKNRKVVYQATPDSKLEEGIITSWNEHYIFVDFQNVGRGQATPPEKLKFIS